MLAAHVHLRMLETRKVLVHLTARPHGEAMVTATETVTMLLVNTMMATAAQEA